MRTPQQNAHGTDAPEISAGEAPGRSREIVGRLAPSPTGALHLGNARSFLLAWLSVRSRGGRLILRMEDLDHPKVKPWAAAQALDDLRWLGLDWDEGPDIGGPGAPYVQTRRKALYRRALETLQRKGLVYPCICSRRDVESAQSAPHAGEDGLYYPGTCRGKFATYADAAAAKRDGPPAWRFRAPDGAVTEFEDAFCGRQSACVAEEFGDFAIARDESGAGYTLAVVVDDAAMGVTEVLRGDDLLAATHRQMLVARALGIEPPKYAHVPLVVAEDGRRLAKRHGDTRISALREAGNSPKKVVGLLAHWSGLAQFGAEASPRDLLAQFSPGKVPRGPAVLTQGIRRYLSIR